MSAIVSGFADLLDQGRGYLRLDRAMPYTAKWLHAVAQTHPTAAVIIDRASIDGSFERRDLSQQSTTIFSFLHTGK